MKYFLIVLVILVSACKDDKTATSHKSEVGKTVSGQDILVPKKQVKFDCTNESCSESIVAIDQDGEVCTGVVKDSQVLVAKDCNKNLKCESVLITDINNKKYECESLSEEDGIYKLTLTEDISSLNASLGEVHKDDLLVKAIVVSKLDGSYKQISTNCSITFSSVNALASTKENSKNLAIKDCDNLSVGAVIFQNGNLLSINLKSDVLNLSRNMTCEDYCDDKGVDKLEFLIDELTAKTKVKDLKLQIEPSEKDSHKRKMNYVVNDNELFGSTEILCVKNVDSVISLVNRKTSTSYSKYGEVLDSKLLRTKREYLYLEMKYLYLLGKDFLLDRFNIEKSKKVLGVISEADLFEVHDFEEYLNKNEFNFRKVEVKKCPNFYFRF